MLNLQMGSVISIRHYSGINPFKSILLEMNEEIAVVRLTKDFAIMNFFEGDPVVFGFEAEGQVHSIGCDISRINVTANTIELKIDKVEVNANKRAHERFPVSIYADVRTREERKKSLLTIKDISYYGMLVYSKNEYKLEQLLELDIYMEKLMLFLKTLVVRKSKRDSFHEYGLRITYEDVNTMNYMKEYLKRLKEEQDEAIRRMKNL